MRETLSATPGRPARATAGRGRGFRSRPLRVEETSRTCLRRGGSRVRVALDESATPRGRVQHVRPPRSHLAGSSSSETRRPPSTRAPEASQIDEYRASRDLEHFHGRLCCGGRRETARRRGDWRERCIAGSRPRARRHLPLRAAPARPERARQASGTSTTTTPSSRTATG